MWIVVVLLGTTWLEVSAGAEVVAGIEVEEPTTGTTGTEVAEVVVSGIATVE